jgi:NADH:ubiquinone oxidoreductase subunit 2 (subunit N)
MSKVWGMSKYTLLVMVIAEMDSGGLVVWLSLLSNLQAYFYMKGVLAFLTKKCEQNKEQTIKDMSCYDCM